MAEAAGLAEIHPVTARRWFLGRRDYPASGPVLRPDYPPVDGACAVSFLDLVDLHVVGRFRNEGISLQTIRKVYQRLLGMLASAHPFCHHSLLTDGRRIFLEQLSKIEAPDLEDILSGQKAFHEILTPYLKRIEYNPKTHLAERWNIAEGVIIDPHRCFGKPVLNTCNTTTLVLARAFEANDRNETLVADLFDIAPQEVIRAVNFERRFPGTSAA